MILCDNISCPQEMLQPCRPGQKLGGHLIEERADGKKYMTDAWSCLVKKVSSAGCSLRCSVRCRLTQVEVQDQPQTLGQWKSFTFTWDVEENAILKTVDVALYKCFSNDRIVRMRDQCALTHVGV